MSLRLRCRSCRAVFLIDDDPPGPRVVCPKCGTEQPPAPAGSPPAPAWAAGESVFVPADPARPARRRLGLVAAALGLLAVASVAVVVAWPALDRWWHPVPPDPVETVATAYLNALIEGNTEAAGRIGTVDLPPAIRSVRDVRHAPDRDKFVRGSFAPIAAFHAKVAKTYTYDPETGRYTPKNPLGPAAETLDALHDAKAKAEADALAEKIRSGNPDDLFDAAEGLAKSFSKLSEGVLSPKKLIPSYAQLIADARPPLPPAERELALDFARHRETWDALLKRPFPTLQADGPFLLERAEVTASVVDALGSSGAPPTPLRLTLTRFRLEGIDTGWRVTSARRVGAGGEEPEEPEVPTPDAPLPPSPGETPPARPSPGLGGAGTPG